MGQKYKVTQTATAAKEGKEDGSTRLCGYFYGKQSCSKMDPNKSNCFTLLAVLECSFHQRNFIVLLVFFWFFSDSEISSAMFCSFIPLERKRSFKNYSTCSRFFLIVSLTANSKYLLSRGFYCSPPCQFLIR